MQVLATSCNVMLYPYSVEHLSLNRIVHMCTPQMIYHQLLKSRLSGLRTFECKCKLICARVLNVVDSHFSNWGKAMNHVALVRRSTFTTFIESSGTYAFSKSWNRDAAGLPLDSRKHSYNESVLGLRQPNLIQNFGMLWSTQVKQEITRGFMWACTKTNALPIIHFFKYWMGNKFVRCDLD